MNAIPPIANHATVSPSAPADASRGSVGAKSTFGNLLMTKLGEINAQHVNADQQIQSLVAGESDDVGGVVLSMAKAELGFRFMIEMRNQLVETYQELMRMQI